MYQYIPSKNRTFTAYLAIENVLQIPQTFEIFAQDMNKLNTYYTYRVVDVKPINAQEQQQLKKGQLGSNVRVIKMMFPLSPAEMMIYCSSQTTKIPANYKDNNFNAAIVKIENNVTTCDVWIDDQTNTFVKLAQEFSQSAGFLSTGFYRSNNGEFLINYQPYLVNEKTGMVSTTPSRVGHVTGKIEVSQRLFVNYTVPQRFLILLHEYMHKFNNPKVQREISDEAAADMQALYIYLGKGFPRIDAYEVFLNIFYRAKTEENAKRIEKIDEFIKRFDARNSKIKCTK